MSEEKPESLQEEKPTVVDRTPEEYAKRLVEASEEAKKYRQKMVERGKELDSLKKKLEEIESSKMQEQGKFKELAESYKKEADEWKKRHESAHQTYAYKVITSQIKAEAAKIGCVDPDALIQLTNVSDLEVDDDFNIKQESLKALMDQEFKKRSYLFKKDAPQIKDGTPAGENTKSHSDLYLSELSKVKTQKELDELRKKYNRQ